MGRSPPKVTIRATVLIETILAESLARIAHARETVPEAGSLRSALRQVGSAFGLRRDEADPRQKAQEALLAAGIEADVLDLSLLTSSYDLHIHPWKGCVSTAMPLCHWPCSCYPNHGARQTND